MNFDDAPEDAAFRAEWGSWLETYAARRAEGAGFNTLVARGGDDEAGIERAKAWQALLASAGWGAIAWPTQHGGRAATPTQAYIFGQLLSEYDVPPDLYSIGLGMIGPTLIAWGTDAQKAAYLPPMLDGSEVWCQLWSEPNAGSDLASVRTKAVLDPERGSWIVNGQKVWTSGAQWSRWGLAIVRTDPDVAAHKGLSALVIDMTAPGVDVRPLREMSGGSTFNEVFFTDVEVPAENVIGPAGQGWMVALTTMAHERLTAGMMGIAAMKIGPLLELARSVRRNGRPVMEDPVLRHRLVDVVLRHRILELNVFRTLTAVSRTGMPGPESSTLKLLWSDVASAQADLAVDLLGISGTLTGPHAPYGGEVPVSFAFAPSFHIGGGTDEVQRNVIGERVLGLPREPRPV